MNLQDKKAQWDNEKHSVENVSRNSVKQIEQINKEIEKAQAVL